MLEDIVISLAVSGCDLGHPPITELQALKKFIKKWDWDHLNSVFYRCHNLIVLYLELEGLEDWEKTTETQNVVCNVLDNVTGKRIDSDYVVDLLQIRLGRDSLRAPYWHDVQRYY